MTRRRASPPASLWTGIFLLLLGHVATERPTTTTGPTRTTLSGLSGDQRGRPDNATVFHEDRIATTLSSGEEHTTRFAPRGTVPDQLERTVGSINDEEEVPATSEQSPSTATTGSNLHFMTGESTFATVPDGIHEIRRARVKNGGVPSKRNERKEITTLFSAVDDDDDDEINLDGARSTFISGLLGTTDHVVPDQRTPSARASTAIPTSKTARLTFEKLGSLAREMENSDEGNSVGRDLPSGAQPREEKKKKKKANEAEVAPPSLLNDTAVNYPKRVGVAHGKSENRGAEVLWEYTDPVRRNESAENTSERGATNAERESSDDLDEARAVDDETTSPRIEEARTAESDDLDASSNGESPKIDDNRESSSKETTAVTEPYSYGQSSTRESVYLSSTLKVSSSSETIFDDATGEAYPRERNAVGGGAPHEGSMSSMSSAGLLNSETTTTRDRQAEADDGPTITESYSHATLPASEYVATTAADPTEPYRHSTMTDSSVVASRSSEYTRGALPVATEETTRSTAEDSSYVRRSEGASSTTIEYEFVGLEETSESHSYATSTIESASSSYASSTSASTDGRVAFATNVTHATRSSVASTNGDAARPEFDSTSSASFYLHDENGTTIAGVWNSSTTSVAGDAEVPRASSSTTSGSRYVEDTESSPASDSTETWLNSSGPADLSDDPTVAPYVDTDDAPSTVELVDATDSTVVLNVTEPPVVLNVTESPVVLNVTDPPIIPNITSPPVVLNVTDPPVVLNVTDPPVVLNVTDPPVVLNVTDPPVVPNVTDPQIVFNVTDPPSIPNITDPPVVRGIDVTDPPASPAPTVDLPDASDSTTSASRWNVTDRSIGTDDASETTAAESTTESALPIVTPPAERVTALVRIVFEGTWSDVCPRLSQLRRALAKLFVTGSDRYVSSNRIIFHQTQCDATARSAEPALTSVLVYVVTEDGAFDEATTEMLPDLYKTTPLDFPLAIRSFLPVQETDSGNAIAVVVVSCVAFVCLVLLAGLLFVMRKRQTRFNYGERCRPVSLDAYSVDSVSAYNSVIRKGMSRASKRSYGNPTFEDSSVTPSHPLNFAGLSSFCSDVAAIAEEFSGIPQISANIDELPPGAEVKNRYANVVPLPETRVPLQRINGDPLTEYINASYVRGPKNAAKYYIACQAPMGATVTDFWRMIWEQQSKVIVMLTDVVENGMEKCVEYIPPSEVTDCHRLYGDYQVTLKKRETKEKYAISTLHLKNLENNTFREISHIWYLWPANGVPSDAAGLVAVLLETRALQRGGPGPVVVHCSPGTGRTGTLIALDLGIRQYEITRTVDVPRVVYTIRRDRAGAVQTKEQYAFIYKALNLYAAKLAGGALESM